jgi:two-component system CheB/CheR fusion protein
MISTTPIWQDDTQRSAAYAGLRRKSKIAGRDGRWFLVRIMPYRTLENVIDGVVITFIDISAVKGLEARLRQAQAELEQRYAEQSAELSQTKANLKTEKGRQEGTS